MAEPGDALRVSMNEIDQDSLRAGMDEAARLEEAIAQLLLAHHVVLYFAADEARRAEIARRLDEAARRGVDVAASADPNVLEWRCAWPAAARAAILALWRTPRRS